MSLREIIYDSFVKGVGKTIGSVTTLGLVYFVFTYFENTTTTLNAKNKNNEKNTLDKNQDKDIKKNVNIDTDTDLNLDTNTLFLKKAYSDSNINYNFIYTDSFLDNSFIEKNEVENENKYKKLFTF